MNILFGIRKPDGATLTERELHDFAHETAPYALRSRSLRVSGCIGMGFQSSHSHTRHMTEDLPFADSDGHMLIIDGRVDNVLELARELELDCTSAADSAIVVAGYRRWREGIFSRLTGDWALVLWSARERRLYLARDHAGSRTLYFELNGQTLRWSTLLETFFNNGEALPLDRDFAVRYLACLPLRDVTPYRGIRAVLPAHYLMVEEDGISQHAHWDWMPRQKICYKSDSDYEQHFFALFKQAVGRRTTDGARVLAQLSGGVDSASIICMSDRIRRDEGRSDLLDTVSFYDDTEPNWNERPYFTIIENHRGIRGAHVDASFTEIGLTVKNPANHFTVFPTAHSTSEHHEQELDAIYDRGNFRALLSGVGGDEILGGVPDALPELIDLFRSGRLGLLLRRSFEWSLVDRSPLIGTLSAAAKGALTRQKRQVVDANLIPPWLDGPPRRRCLELLATDVVSQHSSGLSAVAIDNGSTWWTITESLPHLFPRDSRRLEYRYPYLDKDLVNYMFRIPRDQVVRPGQRRSLMRRALKNIVPPEVLNRRRKAFRIRAPLLALQHSQNELDKLLSNSRFSSWGLVNEANIRAGLRQIAMGIDVRWWLPLTRAVALERWLETSSRYIRA